ncbi:hypothetical protein F2Q70_00015783 [Brassica cretica]|uniref:Uncharacterized protein n=1 Tax=Brassica cretica TaxID=69181 RepID=A0A8S9I2H6_BRACR|nr:hypothetical protein F2Q70_00015783 [Brassica cretica]
MDLSQTGTTSSGINDIDPIGSDSGALVTPTGLTRTNDATETAPTQRVPLIGTSSQDRSLPINQTTVPERTRARTGPSRKGARRASSCKCSGKKSDTPRSIKDDVQPPRHWTVRHSRDPKRPVRTLRRRKFATSTAAGHDPPKLKLQWTKRNQHWTPTPTKHLDPIPERIDGKAGGAKNTSLTTKPLYLRESNYIRDKDLPSSKVR